MAKRNEIIRKLQFDIFHVEKTSKESNLQVVNEATKEQLAEEKNSDGKRTKLQQEIIEQKKTTENQIVKHRESELALRKVSDMVVVWLTQPLQSISDNFTQMC